MTSHDGRRADLPAEGDTPAARRAVRDLRAAYAASPPSHLRAATDRAVYGRLVQHRRPAAGSPSARRPRWPRRRARVVAGLACAAAVLMGATVYAALPVLTPLVDEALGTVGAHSGNSYLVAQHLGQQVDLSRSACGYTMTMTRVYADANRVVIGYIVQDPPGRTDPMALLTLADAAGHELPRLEQTSVGHEASIGQGATGLGNYAAFDAAGALRGSTLVLRLTARLRAHERLDGPLPPDMLCETYLPTAPGSAARVVAVDEPLEFDVRVPADPRVRIVEPRQTAADAGLMLTLDRVVVTPVETRLSLHVPPSMLRGLLSYAVSVGSQTYEDIHPLVAGRRYTTPGIVRDGDGAGADATAAPAALDVPLNVPLYDAHGEWTIIVRAGAAGCAGTWTFRFNSDLAAASAPAPVATDTSQPTATTTPQPTTPATPPVGATPFGTPVTPTT